MSCTSTSSFYNIWSNGGAEEFCSTEYPREGRARGAGKRLRKRVFCRLICTSSLGVSVRKYSSCPDKREDGHVEEVVGQCRLPELHHGPLAHGAVGTDTKLHDAEQPQVAVLMSSKTVGNLIS